MSVQTEMDDLRTRLDQSVTASAVLATEKVGIVEEVRTLSSEQTRVEAKAAEKYKRVEAVRVSVRTEVDGLRQRFAEARKALCVVVYDRKERKGGYQDRMERAVSKVFGSYRQSFRFGP